MKLGIIGRGPWGSTYAKTLKGMGIDYWQSGKDWELDDADGVIIASSPESHFDLAEELMRAYVPIIVEKPVCLSVPSAEWLLGVAQEHDSIVFAGHTHLYSPKWREFKRRALGKGVRSFKARAGGPCKIEPLWDWGPHLVAMSFDLTNSCTRSEIHVSHKKTPMRVVVNDDLVYEPEMTKPTPLEVLITEFYQAIKKGGPNYEGLKLAAMVTEVLSGA